MYPINCVTSHPPTAASVRVVFLILGMLLALVAPAVDTGAVGAPIGYAMVDGTVTGGAGGTRVTVSTPSQLSAAVGSSSPMIITVSGTITATGSVDVKSNKTIIGAPGAVLNGVGMKIFYASNVIVQNLTIRNVIAIDPANPSSTDNDCINIKFSSRIWIDHCEFAAVREFSGGRPSNGEYYDGLIDITRESDYVTVSWNKFHDSHKAILIGAHDAATADRGLLRVTLYDNWFFNVTERQPRVRFGRVHLFNNYVVGGSYGVAAMIESIVRTDNNYFENVSVPISTAITDGPSGSVSGASTNIFQGGGSNNITTAASTWLPPYTYASALIPAADVPARVRAGTGPSSTLTPPQVNTAPTVSGGPDRAVTLPATANLDGTVSDDGMPSGTLTNSWSKVSGPGTVGFGSTSAIDTTASFSTAGIYVLRLSTSDGALSASDDVTVTVAVATGSTPPSSANNDSGGSCGVGGLSAIGGMILALLLSMGAQEIRRGRVHK